MKNVEIKAKVDNIDKIEEKARELSTAPLEVIKQHDIFFKLPCSKQAAEGGRLKLRRFENESGELIYYLRPDDKGPKVSTYSKAVLNPKECQEIKTVLTASNGVLGEIKKIRHLYLVNQTRIHIDRVEGLGNFMEFEVVLSDEDEEATGYQIIENLKTAFGIPQSALLKGAYLDMFNPEYKNY